MSAAGYLIGRLGKINFSNFFPLGKYLIEAKQNCLLAVSGGSLLGLLKEFLKELNWNEVLR